MDKTGYVLIPGGGMSDWVWRDLNPILRHKAVFVDRRIEINTATERRRVTLDDCVQYILKLAEDTDYSHFAIIAHSGGGILTPLVAQHLGDRAKGMVFVAANIPRNQTSALASVPIAVRILNLIAARVQIRSDSIPMEKFATMIRRKFCNHAAEEVIQYVLSQQLLSEPLCIFEEKVDWDGMPKIPMAYVRLLRDQTITLRLQDKMAAHLNIENFYDIDSDHMVMLSQPGKFNDTLQTIFDDLLHI